MRAGELVRRAERDVRAQERLDGHRPDRARRSDEPVGVGQQKRAQRRHQLGPVEEREPLLRAESHRLQPRLPERDERRDVLPAQLHVAAADERQRQVGQRRQVAGCADRPLRRDDRVDPQPEEVQEPVHDRGPAPAMTERERVRPEEQHRPDDLLRQVVPDAHRVADQEVLLEPRSVDRVDRPVGERPEPGRDPVDDGAVGDEPLDDVASLLHPLAGCLVQRGSGTVPRDRLHVGDRQVRAGQDDRVGHDGQDSRLFSPGSHGPS